MRWRESMMLMAMPLAATSCTVTSTPDPGGDAPLKPYVAPASPRARDLATLRGIAVRAATLRDVYGQLLIGLRDGDAGASTLAHRYSTQAAKLSATSFDNPTTDLARARYAAAVITLSVDLQALTQTQLRHPNSAAADRAAALARAGVRGEVSAELGLAASASRQLRHSGIRHLDAALSATS